MASLNRLAAVHPIPILRYPVSKTGTYFNSTTNTYEFWFFYRGKAAKCGECKRSEAKEIVITWRAVTLDGLKKLVLKRMADGTIKTDPLKNL